jgi:transketolase
VKGWQYGIEGRASHGAGHPLCSAGFHAALEPLVGNRPVELPTCCDTEEKRCSGEAGSGVMEACFWEALRIVRGEIERRDPMVRFFAARLRDSRERLDRRARAPRPGAPRIEAVYETARSQGTDPPEPLRLAPGTVTTLRGEMGRVFHYYNEKSGGALLVSAADLLGSTSVSKATEGFPAGYYHAVKNPESRTLSVGGICEDAMAGVSSGLGAFGHNIGIASSYAAFLAPLAHVASRLHAIGQQARASVDAAPYRPMILACAHAGLKTGEDGPTHADPQALQLLQSNFPPGTAVSLTPWDPQELWPLFTAAILRRPAIISVFVTRPNEVVPDRAKLGLAPATAARSGLYRLRAPKGEGDGVVVLQESAVTMAFVTETLPRLERQGIDLDVYYVASAELFDALRPEDREKIFPEERSQEAMGITGFTAATMDRWVRSERGRRATLHPYRKGHFLGSGQGPAVLAEAGLDGDAQFKAVKKFLDAVARAR